MKNLQAIYKECKKELWDIGIVTGFIKKVVEDNRAKKRWGNCEKEGNEYIIKISSELLQDNVSDTSLKNTLIHEMLHTIEGGMTHKGNWKKAAERVNRLLGYNIKRTTSYEEKGIERNEAIYKFIVKCEKCGTEYKRIKMGKLIQHPENFRCGLCKGELIRIR